jgi:hypothetical protein
VPENQVFLVSGQGQSNLINHKSTYTFAATGATTNGNTILANCQAAAKNGWFSSSDLAKQIKKATDTWMPGDSIKVKKATCAAFKVSPNVARPAAKTGRKLL